MDLGFSVGEAAIGDLDERVVRSNGCVPGAIPFRASRPCHDPQPHLDAMIFNVAMQPLCAMMEAFVVARAFDEIGRRLAVCASRERRSRPVEISPPGSRSSD